MKFNFVFVHFLITITVAQFIQRDPGLEIKLTNLTEMEAKDMTIQEFEERKEEI